MIDSNAPIGTRVIIRYKPLYLHIGPWYGPATIVDDNHEHFHERGYIPVKPDHHGRVGGFLPKDLDYLRPTPPTSHSNWRPA